MNGYPPGLVHARQYDDWASFKRHPKTWRVDSGSRRAYPEIFQAYKEAISQRRKRFDLEGDVHLLFDSKHEDPLQRWIEIKTSIFMFMSADRQRWISTKRNWTSG